VRLAMSIAALPDGRAGLTGARSLRRPHPPQAGDEQVSLRDRRGCVVMSATCGRRVDHGIGETAPVTDRRRSPLNLNVLLGAVEAAPPVAAAEVFGDALSEALGARDVSFLIADYSGHSLIRLSHLPRGGTATAIGRERSDSVPLGGTPHGARWPSRRSRSSPRTAAPACMHR
jgi:hypothetical protein